jgi:hypothetical protein
MRDGATPPSALAPAPIDVQVSGSNLEAAFASASEVAASIRTLPGVSDASLVANAGGIGFYRVKYDEALAGTLAQRFVRLAPADQVTLLSDTFALAQAGELPMTSWLALVNQIPKVTGPARTTLVEQVPALVSGFSTARWPARRRSRCCAPPVAACSARSLPVWAGPISAATTRRHLSCAGC